MDIVLENPAVAPSSSLSPTATTPQLGLPMHHPPPPSHHFPHRAALYDTGAPLLLPPAEDYYARGRQGPTPSYDRELDGASAPVTVRRIDKSGLLEIAEVDPAVCPRPRVLTGAEDVATRTAASYRIDRTGLLEAVPEAVDQLEEHCGNESVSIECGVASAPVMTFDESDEAPRGEASRVDADAFDGARCTLERPSALEGQARSDEIGARVHHSADVKVLTGSPRNRESQFDISVGKATERLPRFSSFSPGPSLRHLRTDLVRGTSSPLTGRRADADSAQPRNHKSPEFVPKYSLVSSAPKNLTSRQSQQSLASSTSDYLSATSFRASPTRTAATPSPIMRGQRSQTERSRDDYDPTSIGANDSAAAGSAKAPCESPIVKESATRESDGRLPDEERAEAEGCEHTGVEGLDEDKVSFKGSNKLLDNDNVQTLRVIILSEQL